MTIAQCVSAPHKNLNLHFDKNQLIGPDIKAWNQGGEDVVLMGILAVGHAIHGL